MGGGIAGWTAAATLARKLGGHCSIHVVDSAEPATAGIGEATQPAMLELLRFLGADQNDFIDKTQSTYCLGTRFVDWAEAGQVLLASVRRLRRADRAAAVLSLLAQGARAGAQAADWSSSASKLRWPLANRFIFPTNTLGVAQHMRYALHMDRALAARYLRGIAERAGVIRLERKVVSATRREDGFLEELKFEDGGSLRADLFLDCTGARAQLIGEFLGDALRRLEAVAALRSAWSPRRWRSMTCVRRTCASRRAPPAGSGACHCSTAPASARSTRANSRMTRRRARNSSSRRARRCSEPRLVQFTSGRRRSFWDKNVVALGHAAGFLEPLAGADMHLLGNALFNLLDHFPDRQFDPAIIASYNAAIGEDFERIRDFIILHYCTSRRDDSPFWQQRAAAAVPRLGRAAARACTAPPGASCSSGPSSSPTSTGSGSSKAAA